MENVDSFKQTGTKWWLWLAILETHDSELLLYANLLPNTKRFSPRVDDDKGYLNLKIGRVTYCSKIITDENVCNFMEEIDKNSRLKLGLLDSSIKKEFSITAYRKIINNTFGKSVVPIKTYYTTPDLLPWYGNLDDLSEVLLLLKNELNLPFDNEYARKFGNFEIHNINIAMDSSLSVKLMNRTKSKSERAYIRIARKPPLLDSRQQLHIICREKKDIIYQKIIPLDIGKPVIEIYDLPEDASELECWAFDELGELIFQDHQHYIESIAINMGISGREVIIKDKLTNKASSCGKKVGYKASVINKTATERSLIQPNTSKYKLFNDQMLQLQSDLFNSNGNDKWFGKSIESEVEVIKHFQSLLGGGKAKKAIVVDPFFGSDAFERFVTRVEESNLELIVLTSLSDINPDTGEKFLTGSEPIELLKKSVKKVKDLINCELRLININRGKSKQAFHDRYMIVYPFDGLPTIYILSNSINKMSGNWPFCMSKLEPATARHVREYIENLCEGRDNSRKGDPTITYEWSRK